MFMERGDVKASVREDWYPFKMQYNSQTGGLKQAGGQELIMKMVKLTLLGVINLWEATLTDKCPSDAEKQTHS